MNGLRCVALTLLTVATGLGETLVFDDFESGRLGQEWKAQGDLTIASIDAPETDSAEGPSGVAMRAKTGGKSVAFFRARREDIAWPSVETVSFWIHRSKSEAAARPESIVELQLYESNNRTRMWRKVVLDHVGWRRVEVPTRWMAWSDDRAARWSYVNRLGIWFRDGADLTIDDITLDVGPKGSAYLDADEIAEVAFGVGSDAVVKKSPQVTLISDATDAPLDAIVRHLDAIATDVAETVPGLGKLEQPATLVLFAEEDDYRGFVKKYAARQDRQAARPRAEGFTFEGIATTWHKPSSGRVRPVLTHEFVHSYLTRRARFRNRGGWLQEGMATYFQLKHHPQRNIRRLVKKGVANPKFREPLAELTTGKKIAMNRYWQAMTVIDLFLNDPAYRAPFERILTEMQRTGSTELEPFVRGVLESDWERFEADWAAFCDGKY